MRPGAGRRRAAPRASPSRVVRSLSCVTFCLVAVAGLMVLFSFRGARDDGFATQLHRQAGVRPLRSVPGAVVSVPYRGGRSKPEATQPGDTTAAPVHFSGKGLRDVWGAAEAPTNDEVAVASAHEASRPEDATGTEKSAAVAELAGAAAPRPPPRSCPFRGWGCGTSCPPWTRGPASRWRSTRT
jgi:hypothetical protein